MTTRRQFIRGAVSVAVAAALPGGDGVELYSAKHPEWGPSIVTALEPVQRELSERMMEALCRSMAQTRERVAANVLNKAFDTPTMIDEMFDLSSLEEIEVDIKGE